MFSSNSMISISNPYDTMKILFDFKLQNKQVFIYLHICIFLHIQNQVKMLMPSK